VLNSALRVGSKRINQKKHQNPTTREFGAGTIRKSREEQENQPQEVTETQSTDNTEGHLVIDESGGSNIPASQPDGQQIDA